MSIDLIKLTPHAETWRETVGKHKYNYVSLFFLKDQNGVVTRTAEYDKGRIARYQSLVIKDGRIIAIHGQKDRGERLFQLEEIRPSWPMQHFVPLWLQDRWRPWIIERLGYFDTEYLPRFFPILKYYPNERPRSIRPWLMEALRTPSTNPKTIASGISQSSVSKDAFRGLLQTGRLEDLLIAMSNARVLRGTPHSQNHALDQHLAKPSKRTRCL